MSLHFVIDSLTPIAEHRGSLPPASAADEHTPALVRHGMRSEEPSFFPYAAYEERMRRWESASTTRLNAGHWSAATGQPINADLAGRLDTLRIRSEYEIANNPLVAGMISTYTLTVIGSDGPTLEIISGDAEYARRRERIWKDWMRHAASNQQLGLVDCMRLWIRALFGSGEFCNQLISMEDEPGPVKMRLLPIHSHRLLTPPEFLGDPAVALGVRRDLKNRRPTAYYVSQPYLMGAFEVYTGDFLEVPYRDFLHGFLLSEEDQVRGFPWLAPCLDAVAELRDFKISTLDAARAAADWGVYFYTTSPDIPPVPSANQPMAQSFERRQERNLPPGWQVQQVSPQQPPSNWEMLYKAMAREIGRCIDMPLMMMLLDSGGMNYSSARFDGQMFWRGVGYVQGFLQRILDRLEHEVAKEAELAWLAGDPEGLPPSSNGPVERRWMWPKAPHVDPQKEAMAERTRLINGDMTYSELCAAHNKSAEHIIAQRKADNERLKKAGLAPIPGLPDPAAKATAGGPPAGAGQGFKGETTDAEKPGSGSRAPKSQGDVQRDEQDAALDKMAGMLAAIEQRHLETLERICAALIDSQRGAAAGSQDAHDAAVKAAETRGAARKEEEQSDRRARQVESDWRVLRAKGERAAENRVQAVKIPDGGFSYQVVSGHEPTSGFAVSIHPERSIAIRADKISGADLYRYARANRDLLVKPGNYFGAWHNPKDGLVYLDVSKVVHDRGAAEQLCRQHDQKAFFDFSTFSSVTVNEEATSGGAATKKRSDDDGANTRADQALPAGMGGDLGGQDHRHVPPSDGTRDDGAGTGGAAPGDEPTSGGGSGQEDGLKAAHTAALLAIAAAAAATETDPSEAQRAAGNYRKGRVDVQGLPISIETPAGAIRRGRDRDGRPWETRMQHHYGYIRRTESEADGDHVDVFLGPDPLSGIVFVIDQNKAPDFQHFDEHKVMLGFASESAAKEAYLANFPAGWNGFAGITAMSIEAFKSWLEAGETARPIAAQPPRHDDTARAASGGGFGAIFSNLAGAQLAGGEASKEDQTRAAAGSQEAHDAAVKAAATRAGSMSKKEKAADSRQRAERAKATYKAADKAAQDAGDKRARDVAAWTGLKPTGDNEEMDAVGRVARGRVCGLEVKALTRQSNDKITMHPESLARKNAWARSNGAATYTVVIDDRDTFEGGKHAEKYSGHKIYMQRGFGSYRLGSMVRIRSTKQLRDIVRGKKTLDQVSGRGDEGD